MIFLLFSATSMAAEEKEGAALTTIAAVKERFEKSANYCELAYKDFKTGPLDGQPNKPDHVTVKGVTVVDTVAYGDKGAKVGDYYDQKNSGFRAHTMEHGDEIVVAIRGTKDPLHLLLDLSIMFETAGEDPKAAIHTLLERCAGINPDFGGIITSAIGSAASTAAGAASAAVAGSFGGGGSGAPGSGSKSVGGMVWDILRGALIDTAKQTLFKTALPPEVSALYASVAGLDLDALQKAVKKRFDLALGHARDCISKAAAQAVSKGKKLRVTGHSLGGTLGTIAMAQLNAGSESIPAVELGDFAIHTICSPGSRDILKKMSVAMPDDFTARVSNLVRKTDFVGRFGDHIGSVATLEGISEETCAALAEVYGDSSPTKYWKIDPRYWAAAGVDKLKTVKDNHSIVGIMLDLEREMGVLVSAAA